MAHMRSSYHIGHIPDWGILGFLGCSRHLSRGGDYRQVSGNDGIPGTAQQK